jgi:hypothetical protein
MPQVTGPSKGERVTEAEKIDIIHLHHHLNLNGRGPVAIRRDPHEPIGEDDPHILDFL